MANIKLSSVVNYDAVGISPLFFAQLKKNYKLNELSSWYKNFNKAAGEEKNALETNMSELQRAFLAYKNAEDVFKALRNVAWNNETVEAPVAPGTNNVPGWWNKDANGNAHTTANDVLRAYLNHAADSIKREDLRPESLQSLGISLDNDLHVASEDSIIAAVDSIFAELEKSKKSHKKDIEEVNVAINAIDLLIKKTRAILHDTAVVNELLRGYIAEYKTSLNEWAFARLQAHYNLQPTEQPTEPATEPATEPEPATEQPTEPATEPATEPEPGKGTRGKGTRGKGTRGKTK